MSTVKNLETEKARLNERVVTLEETAAKAITKLKRKEIIEMGLRLQGGNDADMQVDEFVVSTEFECLLVCNSYCNLSLSARVTDLGCES